MLPRHAYVDSFKCPRDAVKLFSETSTACLGLGRYEIDLKISVKLFSETLRWK